MNQKDIELSIISCILHSEDDLNYLQSEQVLPKLFIYKDEDGKHIYRGIYSLIIDYYFKNYRILTTDALTSLLKEKYNISAGDIRYDKIMASFLEALSLVPDHNSLPVYVNELRKNYVRSKLVKVIDDTINKLEQENSIKVLDDLRQQVLDVSYDAVGNRGDTKIFNFVSSIHDILEEYERREQNPELYKGIEIGLRVLDEATFGFKRGTLNIIVGEVGKGKSTVLLNWAAESFHRGYNVIFFSFEMPLWQVQARLIAREALIPYERFQKGDLTPDQKERLKNLVTDYANGNYYSTKKGNYFIIVQETSNCTVPFVESIIKKHMVLGPPDAVFCDYLGNMYSEEVLRSRGQPYEHSGKCALELRRLAKIYNFACFTAQQINREGLKRGRKKIQDSPDTFEPYSEDIAGSKIATDAADSVIAFSTNQEERRIYFKKIKCRDFDFQPFSAALFPDMCLIQDDYNENFDEMSQAINEIDEDFGDIFDDK